MESGGRYDGSRSGRVEVEHPRDIAQIRKASAASGEMIREAIHAGTVGGPSRECTVCRFVGYLWQSGCPHVASAGGGILHTVCVNTGASGATLTLYDGASASAAKIAAIAATAPSCFTYDAVLNAGLYAAVSGSIDVTVTILPPPGGIS
jgi:hypothetical protein